MARLVDVLSAVCPEFVARSRERWDGRGRGINGGTRLRGETVYAAKAPDGSPIVAKWRRTQGRLPPSHRHPRLAPRGERIQGSVALTLSTCCPRRSLERTDQAGWEAGGQMLRPTWVSTLRRLPHS